MQANLTYEQNLPSPWAEFLKEVDVLLSGQVQLHCLGGFVVMACYGLNRPTSDVDYISVVPTSEQEYLEEIAGRESKLAKKYKVYVQRVGVTNHPHDYDQRLSEMFPGRFRNLRMFALDPYDLILSKLERNSPKDAEDVEYLARNLHLDQGILRERYKNELRPYLSREGWHDGRAT
jgi:hypothetical protein